MSAENRPTFLSLLALLFALTLPRVALGQQTAEDFVDRGHAKVAEGDSDGAISEYSKAIELDPKYAEAYNNRGIAKKDRGDLDDAIADYSKVIELNPNLASAYNNRGIAKKAKGDWAGADADFAQAEKTQEPLIAAPTTIC